MVFSTVTFLFYFLPLFIVLYFALPFRMLRNTVLLVASLVFYAWGEPKNLPLLLISILLNYVCGLGMGRAQEKGGTGKAVFIAGIGFNLVLLAYFKYFNFALSSVIALLAKLGIDIPAVEAVTLPLGISFFSFHAISYLVDVYRKKTRHEKSLLALAMYITMFPQLIAGPIIRYSTIARQLHQRQHTLRRVELGIKIFILGLAQKVLIANSVALPADQIFSLAPEALGLATAWLGITCYSLQIYFDFFGYSNMAIGLGLVTGFSFPRNFNYPYIAQSITEFWQRWHLSLSRWFRDYLYIPLGGNRGSSMATYRNLFIVFFLCGLWHGASWTFVAWGLYHGTFLVLERIGLQKTLLALPRLFRHVYTILVIMVGWVFFRCDSFTQALHYLWAMAGGMPADNALALAMRFLNGTVITALIAGLLVSTPILQAFNKPQAQTRIFAPAISLMLFVLSAISLATGAYNPFIYFRF
ncbi:MBOAT family O-acyltransferase [Undibacterium sp. Di27W]|uniref:MBOAT family O-acyltransferase n=1 Tax=Undibacterium sp. Di27W TaxID=3413036 RepID=UPI003BF10882